jgi:hypothetical protein
VTIQDWGSIGELIAAVATVATLIYLAVQIRANTTALRVESRRSESRSGNVFLSAIVGSSDVARMFNEGLADPTSLSPEDVTRFTFLLGNIIAAEAAAFDEVHIGFAPEDSLDRMKTTLCRFLLSPGGRWFWERFAADYHVEFRSYVEQVLRDAAPAA